MSLRPFRNIDRKKTKVINVGNVKIGGDNPISVLSLIHISEPTRPEPISYAVFCLKKTERLIKQNNSISYKKLSFDKDLSKVSIIGVGMITIPGITYRMFQALASKKINILVISTSEIKISVLISSKNVKKAVAVLHKEFKLD